MGWREGERGSRGWKREAPGWGVRGLRGDGWMDSSGTASLLASDGVNEPRLVFFRPNKLAATSQTYLLRTRMYFASVLVYQYHTSCYHPLDMAQRYISKRISSVIIASCCHAGRCIDACVACS